MRGNRVKCSVAPRMAQAARDQAARREDLERMGTGRERLEVMGASIDQVGDTELGATATVSRIRGVLKLIKVSRVPLRNPTGHPSSLRTPVSGLEIRANADAECLVGT